MFLFRVLCALLLAWAFNLALGRPEAVIVLQELAQNAETYGMPKPDLLIYGPIAGGIVGFLNLAVRQGWGMIVGLANGIWAGALSIAVAALLMFIASVIDRISSSQLKDFQAFVKLSGQLREVIVEPMMNIQFIVVTLGIMAVVGVITEIAQWLVARVRNPKRHDPNTTI